jgi:hypothetical protein
MHLEFLLEEESCAEALRILVPKMLGNDVSFFPHTFQGKKNLLDSLPARLHGYSKWLPDDWRIIVLIDRDNDDCLELKRTMEECAANCGLATRSRMGSGKRIQVLNRIAVEELEAWYFGDIEAIVGAFPKVPLSLRAKKGFRDSDAISGGTWESLERVLQKQGYYRAGIAKIELARCIAAHMDPKRNTSKSFRTFYNGLTGLLN